jgi:sulfur-carrier protein
MTSQSTITVTVKLFAIYQDVIQQPEIALQLPTGSIVATVRDQLLEQHPQLQPWRDLTQFGVNLEQVNGDFPLNDGDEVVLIPPVSGG